MAKVAVTLPLYVLKVALSFCGLPQMLCVGCKFAVYFGRLDLASSSAPYNKPPEAYSSFC